MGKFRKIEDDVLSITGEDLTRVEGLVVSRYCRIPLVLLARYGAFVFVETTYKKSEDITMAMFAIKKTLYLKCDNVYVFIRSPACDYIFSDHFISSEDIERDRVETIMEASPKDTVLSASTIKALVSHMKRFANRGDRRILVKDGITYELHSVGSPLGLYVRDEYFPVADDDPKKFLLLAIFGGAFGLHRFAAGEYARGIFYLLTCGGFGVFFLFDIMAILTGSYYVRQVSYIEDGDTYRRSVSRIYLRKPDGRARLWGAAGWVFAAYSSYFLYVKLFIPALCGIGSALIGA